MTDRLDAALAEAVRLEVTRLRSKPSDEQTTPRELFDEAQRRWGPFDIDCAATSANTLCHHFWSKESNALLQQVQGNARCWLNPPYSRGHLQAFLRWARGEVIAGRSPAICCLVPADPSVGWWRRFVLPDDARVGGVRLTIDEWGTLLRVPYRHHVLELLLLSGRWPFNGAENDPKFGSAFVTYLSPVGRVARTGPRYVVTTELERRVLEHLERGASTGEACELVGVDKRTWYRHLKRKES